MALILRCVHRVRQSLFGQDWPEGIQAWVRSDHLMAQPSALSGAVRLVDLLGQLDTYNISLTPRQADAIALYSDWRVIGQDLWQVMNSSERPAAVEAASAERR